MEDKDTDRALSVASRFGRKTVEPVQAAGPAKSARRRFYLCHFANFRKIPTRRLIAGGGALLILFSVVSYLPLTTWLTNGKYQLSSETLELVGSARPELAKKLALNSRTGMYEFNPEAKQPSADSSASQGEPDHAAVAAMLQKQQQQKSVVGDTKDANLYSLDLPIDASQGITITDNNANLSFKMIPQFEQGQGRKTQDRLVYPLSDGVKAVYTVKNNGLKEDIVYRQAPKDGQASYSYKLELPSSLEARLNQDGSLGVYSADPALFGNISYGTDYDRVKVESAREQAAKDHLVFGIPKPVIVAADGKLGNATSWFTLENNVLTVEARDLNTIKGAFSIDPTVVVTSSSEFATGNNEGNIDFSSANEIKRATLTGGNVASWGSTTAPSARRGLSCAAYNAFIYCTGGSNSPTTRHSSLNSSTGAIDNAWTSSTNDFTNGRSAHETQIYNGYIYVMGGTNGTIFDDVQFAPLDPTTGNVSAAWQTTTALPAARDEFASVAYNGYMYIFGGWTGSANIGTSHYAPINADGTLGSWTATTALISAGANMRASVYNGYVYLLGGGGSTNASADVEYAPINADGTLGSWVVGTSLPSQRHTGASYIHNGYIYYVAGRAQGGATTSQTYYAPLYADGRVGAWNTSNILTNARYDTSGAAYNGYLYVVNGYNGSANISSVEFAKINPAGTLATWATTTAFTSTRNAATSAAHNGFLYVAGGRSGTTRYGDVRYAAIAADGTVGTWNATNSFTTTRYGHSTVVANGYLYIIGGSGSSGGGNAYSDVQYALICTGRNNAVQGCNATAGTVGTWTSTTAFTTARYFHTSVVSNGYMYVLGGYDGTTTYNDVQYALVCTGSNNGVGGCGATAGAVGTWTGTNAFTTARYGHTSIVNNGYMYVIGGTSGTTLTDVRYVLICTGSNNGVGGCGATAGTVGTWTSTTGFTTARYHHVSVVHKGYVYIVGGLNSSSLNSSEYAPLNSDGTIGTWASTTAFTTALYGQAAAEAGGHMYLLGGWDGSNNSSVTDVQYAQINNGGNGRIGSWTLSGNYFTDNRKELISLAHNGFLYVLGGIGSGYKSDVQYAPLSSDGSVGTWTGTTSFTTGRDMFDATIYNGYMYIAGGYNGSALDSVYYALICNGSNSGQEGCDTIAGEVGDWTSGTVLPATRYDHRVEAYGGYLYVMGGTVGGSTSNDIRYASLNATTGAVGTWNTTNNFTTSRNRHESFAINGYMYILGGITGGFTTLKDVQKAKINGNGTLDPWVSTNGMLEALDGTAVTVANGHVYITGGYGTGYSDRVYYAPILSNGDLGEWMPTTVFGNARVHHSAAYYNGYLYVVGGEFSGGSLNETRYAPISSINSQARYSKLIDLGSAAAFTNITYTGTLPGGKDALSFRRAGVDGIFGSTIKGSKLTGSCSYNDTRFVLFTFTLDATQSGIYPDSSSTKASLQDITLDYTSGGVPPEQRLRGGATLQNGVKSGMDLLKLSGSAPSACS